MIYKSYLIEKKINEVDCKLLLFYGENLGLKNDFKKKIKSNNKSHVKTIYQEEILKNKNDFLSEIFNISLFDEKKIYFIDQANDKILEIIEELENKVVEQKFFFFSDNLDKKSKLRSFFEKSKKAGIVPCYPDNEIALRNIILQELKNFKGLTTEALNIILNSCNLDRLKLNNEIDKILSYFDNKTINIEKLGQLLNLSENENFNHLKDAAINGNKKQTNKLMSETLIESEKNLYYLSLINQRLFKLSEIKELALSLNINEALNKTKPPIFWKDKPMYEIQLKKWSSNKIKTALEKTYNYELKLKSNYILNREILLKKLLVEICELANS